MAKSKKKIEALNETGKRKSDRRQEKTKAEAKASAPAVDRRKVKRRRQIDPTTCEREYSELEIEFMHAMDEYKRASGRMFPTCSEILEVLTNLGYRKLADAQPLFDANADAPQSEEDFDSIDEEQFA
jgi:hypothetical protein